VTDTALKAAVDRDLYPVLMEQAGTYIATLYARHKIPTHQQALDPAKYHAFAADLRTLLASLSSQAEVMEAMAKALEQSFGAAKPVAEAINRAANRGPDAKVTLTVKEAMAAISTHTAARTALSQYRTLTGVSHD